MEVPGHEGSLLMYSRYRCRCRGCKDAVIRDRAIRADRKSRQPCADGRAVCEGEGELPGGTGLAGLYLMGIESEYRWRDSLVSDLRALVSTLRDNPGEAVRIYPEDPRFEPELAWLLVWWTRRNPGSRFAFYPHESCGLVVYRLGETENA